MPDWRERARSLLREPLVHFLGAGALVFLVMSGRPPDVGERRIVVDAPVVGGIVDRYIQAFHRPPSNDELDGLIRDYVRSEVYYREALRLGLDKDDEVVKKRLRNKMLALATANAEAAQPTDAQLQALLDRDPARYAAPPSYTLEQRYLGPDTSALRAAISAALAKGDIAALTEVPAPLPARFTDAPPSDIATAFGDDFAESLSKAPVGQWFGPVVSGFGLHVARIMARKPGAPARLADVRQRLENDWRSAAISKAEDDNLTQLLKGYDVVIERPQ